MDIAAMSQHDPGKQPVMPLSASCSEMAGLKPSAMSGCALSAAAKLTTAAQGRLARGSMGLKRKHHKELNRVNVATCRYAQLRRQYAGDPIAQQQIDVYDPATEYHNKLALYKAALKSDDEAKQRQLEAWFAEHYPDI